MYVHGWWCHNCIIIIIILYVLLTHKQIDLKYIVMLHVCINNYWYIPYYDILYLRYTCMGWPTQVHRRPTQHVYQWINTVQLCCKVKGLLNQPKLIIIYSEIITIKWMYLFVFYRVQLWFFTAKCIHRETG